MKNIKYLLASFMLMAATAASAQFANQSSQSSASAADAWQSLKISYSSYTIDEDGADLDPASSLTLGYAKSFAISQNLPLFVETGVNASYTFGEVLSEKDDYVKSTASVSMFTVGIPVNLGYKFAINDEVSIFPYAGINLKYHLKGEIEIEAKGYGESVSETLDMFDSDEGDGDKFQYGLQIGANLNYKKFIVGVSYGFELNEIMEDTKTNALTLTLGVNF
ncbi:MAG: porin family protein [Bacteroidaceae bacterium]|nr:porin family protein [Bacteroidaceae bacterium]